MATVSLSDIRRDPALLAQPGQHYTLTRRGKEVAVLSVVAEAAPNLAKAKAALERLRKATAEVKPNPRGGATAAVRRLRDGR